MTHASVQYEETKPTHSTGSHALKQPKAPNPWIIGLVFAALIAALIAGMFYARNSHTDLPKQGKSIVFEDNYPSPLSNSALLKNWTKTPAPTGVTDPKTLDGYRSVGSDKTVHMHIPIDGECAKNNKGVQPPADYTHVCYYQQGEAMFYTSASVVGDRTGALENIQFMSVGQTVTMGDKDYSVKSIGTYPTKSLPLFLFNKGNVSLVTSHIDSSVNKAADASKVDVVVLSKN